MDKPLIGRGSDQQVSTAVLAGLELADGHPELADLLDGDPGYGEFSHEHRDGLPRESIRELAARRVVGWSTLNDVGAMMDGSTDADGVGEQVLGDEERGGAHGGRGATQHGVQRVLSGVDDRGGAGARA